MELEETSAELFNIVTAFNFGPISRELFMEKADIEYTNDNQTNSVFFQLQSLYQSIQERYSKIDPSLVAERVDKTDMVPWKTEEELISLMSDKEKNDLKTNPLMQYAMQFAGKPKHKVRPTKVETRVKSPLSSCNFLRNISDPTEGIRKIEEICAQLPSEWTILQLCKGYQMESTYSTYNQIQQGYAPIFLTILRHARSNEYPTPICLRLDSKEHLDIYKKFKTIHDRFKETLNVDPNDWKTSEAKQLYWNILNDLDQFIAGTIGDLKNLFYPWNFLFAGKPYKSSVSMGFRQKAFASVDELCTQFEWSTKSRVLLSLAALNVRNLSELEAHAIGNILARGEIDRRAVIKLLLKLQGQALKEMEAFKINHTIASYKCYPCILIVDERLDHIFWEEMNVNQEYCRVNSLQCLWRLYLIHKKNIRNGYLEVDISSGACLMNPDKTLLKMENRMKTFFAHWLPHWSMKIGERPTQDELLNKFFKYPCYVYAGHGSGLQFINGKNVAKHECKAVVFLFGCESTRLQSGGLYSELISTHLYYHAAMCPAVVGSLMPCLDSDMDCISAEVLSRWIAPSSTDVMPWRSVDHSAWIKTGEIKRNVNIKLFALPDDNADKRDYGMASLCGVVSSIHQRNQEKTFYNTVPYVCRGLPVWNISAKDVPN